MPVIIGMLNVIVTDLAGSTPVVALAGSRLRTIGASTASAPFGPTGEEAFLEQAPNAIGEASDASIKAVRNSVGILLT